MPTRMPTATSSLPEPMTMSHAWIPSVKMTSPKTPVQSSMGRVTTSVAPPFTTSMCGCRGALLKWIVR
jgi:hypothetical protein